MIEKQLRGAILKTLKEVKDISVGYLRVLLIYRGIVVQDKELLSKELMNLSDKGYVELEKPVIPKGFEDAQRVKLTAKGYALLDGEIVDNDIELEGV